MYAKVKDNVVIQFPYGYDELQSEFSNTMTGYIEIPDRFQQSKAYSDGFRVLEVVVEKMPLARVMGKRYKQAIAPVFINDVLTIPISIEEVPYPQDGNNYNWNSENGTWTIVSS